MNLDLMNNLFNNMMENKFVQNFMKELSNYLENGIKNNLNTNSNWNNLLEDDLTLYGEKITNKFKDEMLIERVNILQKNASNTGEMYYIYDINSNDTNSYNLCICSSQNSNKIITKQIQELPEGASLGSVLRRQDNKFVLDLETTEKIGNEVNLMIKEKIKEQNMYLDSKRIDGHIYEVDEKYSGRIWLYDLNNSNVGKEGIEEIDFPKDLYKEAQKGDKFIYQNGEYKRY